MAFSDELADAIDMVESARDYFNAQERILAWEGARPGQRVAALVIHASAHAQGIHPTARELATMLGIDPERAAAMFDGLDPAPFELTQLPNEPYRFLPSHALAGE